MISIDTIDTVDLEEIHGGFASNDYIRVCAQNDRYDGCSGMQQQWAKANAPNGPVRFGELPKGANVVHIPGGF